MNESIFKSQTAKEIVWLILLTLIIAYFATIFFGKLGSDAFTEGDFGRDLYNFYLVSTGKFPYLDFNWVYGPLSLILYGFFFKIFGVSILNALILWYLLFIFNIYFLYFFVKSFSHSTLALLAGLSLLFFYGFPIQTFNHVLGTTFILFSLFFIYKYLFSENNLFLYLLCLSSIFLVLTKQNMGIIFSFTVYFLLLVGYKVNKKNLSKIITSFVIFLVSVAILYLLFYLVLPPDQLAKNFLCGSQNIQNVGIPFPQKLFVFDTSLVYFNFLKEDLLLNLYSFYFMNLWYLIIPVLAITCGVFIVKKEKNLTSDSIFIFILAGSAIVNSHEFFIVSTSYSLRFWVLPVLIIILFYCINYIYNNWRSNKYVYYPVLVFSFLYISAMVFQMYNFNLYSYFKDHYLPYNRAKVSFVHPQWLSFVVKSVDYINSNSNNGDKVLTIPYNTIYNFLAERDMPTRIMEFEYLSNISNNDQKKIIEDLEKNKVNIIMISQKSGPTSEGIGVFGLTHCKLLSSYINNNYYIDIYYSPTGRFLSAVPIYFFKRKVPFRH